MPIYVNDIAMSNPGDAPFVPNLLSGLFMNFNAKLDAPNNDSVITSLVTRGNAPLLDRTFDKKRGSALTFPVSVGGSTPYIQFSGTNSLANSNAEGSSTNSFTLVQNEVTFAIRMRVKSWAGANTVGFLRGVANRTVSLRPGSSAIPGSFLIGGGNTSIKYTTINTPVLTDEWVTVIISYSATKPNLFLAGSSGIVEFAMEAGSSIQGMGFGSNITNTVTEASVFDMSYFAVWDRALSSSEILSLKGLWDAGGDIQD